MLIVENGQGIENADTYISLDECIGYAEDFNHSSFLAITETSTQESLIRQATQFIDGVYAELFTGKRASSMQALSYPRTGASIEGLEINIDVIPSLLKKATCEASCILAEGTELFNTQNPQIKIEAVDVLKTEYFESEYKHFTPIIDAILKPLLKPSGSISSIPILL